MTETHDHNPTQQVPGRGGGAICAVVICTILVVVIALSGSALFRASSEEVRASRAEPRYPLELQSQLDEQAARLRAEPHWEIRAEGERSLVIPIDLAVEAVIREAGDS